MILSELVDLYDRLSADDEFASRLPRMGMSTQNIVFYVVLTPEGKLSSMCRMPVWPRRCRPRRKAELLSRSLSRAK